MRTSPVWLTLPAGNSVLEHVIFHVVRDHQPLARQPLPHSLHRRRGSLGVRVE
jgi:hypothetical protein